MLKILLFPFSFLYSIIIKIRNALFDWGVLRSFYFNETTIITVGNITVGGTGKTPQTEYLVNLLKDKYKIAVLSRGYKRKSKGFLYVEEGGKYKDFGDEPLQMKNKYPDVPIAVSKNRILGIRKLKKEKNVDVIILDDAFQHRKVKPKFSILLTTYSNPFFKDNFLPVGKLRDNKSEYLRAKIIIVTKCPPNIKPIQKSIWEDDINVKPFQDLYFSKISYRDLKNIFSKKEINLQANKQIDILAITGIANTSHFIEYLNQNYSKKITHLKFRDHKNFTDKDIKKIITTYNNIKSNERIIITTEKDAVRLGNFKFTNEIKRNFFYLPIETEFIFDAKQTFDNQIIQLIKSK